MTSEVPFGPWGPPTPFSNWSFLWAVICLVSILLIRFYLRWRI